MRKADGVLMVDESLVRDVRVIFREFPTNLMVQVLERKGKFIEIRSQFTKYQKTIHVFHVI